MLINIFSRTRPFNNNNYLCTGFLNIRTTQPQNKLNHLTVE